jgi:hypothetical protein
MIRPPCPTCGQRFGHEDDCAAVTHLHQGSQWPGNEYFRHLCGNDWQLSAWNAKDAFAIWLHEVEEGTITDPVRARHISIARRFRDALRATAVYWLGPPDIGFNVMLPGSWQIWMEIVVGYRCQWDRRQPPSGFDGDAMRAALGKLETLARRVKGAKCACQYRLRHHAGAEHPQHCDCFCHRLL